MFSDVNLKVQLLSENAKMPSRAHPEDAGMDVYTPIDFVIPAKKDYCVPLDIRVEFPKGFVLVVEEKSGIATKKKLDVGAKIIDSGYEGNCHVHLFNNSEEEVLFNKGEKIAQVVLYPIWCGQPIQVEKIETDTNRGTGGFGSTGVN